MRKLQEPDNLSKMKLRNFYIETLELESNVLKNNSLGDVSKKTHYVLLPKNNKDSHEKSHVVWFLSGFGVKTLKHFKSHFFKKNLIENLDKQVSLKKAPRAIYVFIDAYSLLGGSQFLNSVGTGRYEDHLIQELRPFLIDNFSVKKDSWSVMGASSGGYGALHLASKFDFFSYALALSPDGFFEQSLLPDIYKTLSVLDSLGGVKSVLEKVKNKNWDMNQKYAFSILNALGMGLCYAPLNGGEVDWPVDKKTGNLKEEVWKRWKSHDPIFFLKERQNNFKCYLESGIYDEFSLHWASRQIAGILNCSYSEFEGGHFGLSKRYLSLWEWLEGELQTHQQ